ncbi:MAG: response regulator [Polyangiaceae bacterium]
MKQTLLIVDDEEDLREMLRDALERRGFDVVTAANGKEGLEAIARIDHLGIVLLDLIMPEMNGWEFFDALRARSGYEGVPVIVTTSAASRAPKGATRVMQKPLSLDHVVATVNELCADAR